MAQLTYSLHPSQGRVWIDKARYRVLVAGRRFGKTTLAIYELFQSALLHDKSLSWYISPTYRQSKMIAWQLLKEIIPEAMIVRKFEVELRIVLDNGSQICLKGADNEDTLRGVGVKFVVLDEYAQMKSNVWFQIIRPMLTDTEGRALFIGTPKGKNSLWELFIKGQKEEDNFKSWRFKTSDNPIINPDEIELARQELPERYFRQEYEASFEDYVGLVWPEFNKKHLIDPIQFEDKFQRVGSIDPAISGTTGVLKAVIDGDGKLIIYDEYYEPNKRVSEICPAIRDKKTKWIIDPASAANNVLKEGKLYSIYNEYSENGIFANTAEHNVDAGINRVAEYLKTDKIKIYKSCKNLIWELERYRWSEQKDSNTGNPKPKPYKVNDHLCDCLRYLVMSRPHPSDMTRTKPVPRMSVEYELIKDREEENDTHWREKYAT